MLHVQSTQTEVKLVLRQLSEWFVNHTCEHKRLLDMLYGREYSSA